MGLLKLGRKANQLQYNVVLSLFIWGGICSAATASVVFEPLGQTRTVHIAGELNAYNFETQKTSTASFNDSDNSLPDGWDPLRMGMDISLPVGDCFGQGVASQSLIAGGSSIHFTGLADVNVSGISSYPLQLEGSGNALVQVEYRFRVASTQIIDLYMNSSIGDFQDDDYTFSLKSSTGTQVWNSTGVFNEQGGAVREFTRQLVLKPGDYTVAAKLGANSYLSAGQSFAGRTSVEFSISAVPEPSTGCMFAMGGLWFFWRAAKNPRRLQLRTF